jgi:hypothetical protein
MLSPPASRVKRKVLETAHAAANSLTASLSRLLNSGGAHDRAFATMSSRSSTRALQTFSVRACRRPGNQLVGDHTIGETAAAHQSVGHGEDSGWGTVGQLPGQRSPHPPERRHVGPVQLRQFSVEFGQDGANDRGHGRASDT